MLVMALTCVAPETPTLSRCPEGAQLRPLFRAPQHLSIRGRTHVGCTPAHATAGCRTRPNREPQARRGTGSSAASLASAWRTLLDSYPAVAWRVLSWLFRTYVAGPSTSLMVCTERSMTTRSSTADHGASR